MAASVSGAVLLDRVMRSGLRFLRQPRQRVEFADDADDRFPGSERGDKCRGNVGDAGAHLEAGGFQLLLQERAALYFLIADFREAPDVFGDARIVVAPRIHSLRHRGLVPDVT